MSKLIHNQVEHLAFEIKDNGFYIIADSQKIKLPITKTKLMIPIEHFYQGDAIPPNTWTTKTFTFTTPQVDTNYYIIVENTGDQCFAIPFNKTTTTFQITFYNKYTSNVNIQANVLVYRTIEGGIIL